MKIKLKYLHSPDITNWDQLNSKVFDRDSVLVQAIIGPENTPGEESFNFILCKPSWVEHELSSRDYLFGKGKLIVNNFDYELVFNIVENLCQRISGENWEEIAIKLNRYFHWEFEDYIDWKKQ